MNFGPFLATIRRDEYNDQDMNDEERLEEEEGPRRPRVVDRRISARKASGEAPPEPTPEPEPRVPEREPVSSPETQGAAPDRNEPSAAPPAGGREVWTPEQEAEAQRMAEEIARTPSLDWVVQTAVTLANVAGTKLQMGSVADAQLAIDSLAAIVDAAGARLEDAETPLRQTLAQLQMMYAERMAPPPGAQPPR